MKGKRMRKEKNKGRRRNESVYHLSSKGPGKKLRKSKFTRKTDYGARVYHGGCIGLVTSRD